MGICNIQRNQQNITNHSTTLACEKEENCSSHGRAALFLVARPDVILYPIWPSLPGLSSAPITNHFAQGKLEKGVGPRRPPPPGMQSSPRRVLPDEPTAKGKMEAKNVRPKRNLAVCPCGARWV